MTGQTRDDQIGFGDLQGDSLDLRDRMGDRVLAGDNACGCSDSNANSHPVESGCPANDPPL